MDSVLADIRRSVLLSLDAVLGKPSLAELAEVIEVYDQAIRTIIVDSILAYHDVIWPYSTLAEASGTLTFGDTVFEVSTGQDIWEPATLDLAFVPRATSKRPKHPRSIDFSVAGCGRYSTIRVYQPLLDFPFEFHMTRLQAMVASVLETGHSWIAQKLLRLVSEGSLNLSRELYQLLWQLSPRIDRRRVWFLMISEGRAFYLVEEIIGLASIELFSAFTLGSKDPIDLYVEFVTANLPFDLILSRHADKLGIPLDVDLIQSSYRGSNTALVEAELSIFGDQLTIMPLHLDDLVRLVAIYPTQMAAAVSPTLSAHQPDFANILIGNAGTIGELREAIRSGSRASIVAKIGEFFGGFVNGISQ